MVLVGIHPRVLKKLSGALVEAFSRPLSIIYQQSWLTGEVPADWNVVPIYKITRKEDPGNYRPTSLTLVPGKVTEQKILNAVTRHIQNTKVIRLRNPLHGLLKGRSDHHVKNWRDGWA